MHTEDTCKGAEFKLQRSGKANEAPGKEEKGKRSEKINRAAKAQTQLQNLLIVYKRSGTEQHFVKKVPN